MSPCPQCEGSLVSAPADCWRCAADDCPYEMTAEAYVLYAELSDLFERDPEGFFEIVRAHRDAARSLEPAWLR
ncbi:hypothetical protein [Streptomyces pinistramenti]|uniref:hypothetical protein n=1 Tax=Streptomyces pinistramenti TaxID=2884812 RepID=UPI001D070C9D|nr:hypothetical protein [Streptomyces pinistramenti]MCB5910212.1 hypothetical protein [Streptomyces pinistramenti]